ncbi:hypothetical protein CO2235_90217 [Cupriavidus oxalaticus]|uniref:Uncharacterized protein n=1 Tax=Cupriavidus oxalaticus TaxID=96344 RepID=A0A976GBT0_9BURK|nr:hypothetical protein CO2235_90217 [Cupriavidus oxalaticus]
MMALDHCSAHNWHAIQNTLHVLPFKRGAAINQMDGMFARSIAGERVITKYARRNKIVRTPIKDRGIRTGSVNPHVASPAIVVRSGGDLETKGSVPMQRAEGVVDPSDSRTHRSLRGLLCCSIDVRANVNTVIHRCVSLVFGHNEPRAKAAVGQDLRLTIERVPPVGLRHRSLPPVSGILA